MQQPSEQHHGERDDLNREEQQERCPTARQHIEFRFLFDAYPQSAPEHRIDGDTASGCDNAKVRRVGQP